MKRLLLVAGLIVISQVAQAAPVAVEQYGDSTTFGWQVKGRIGYVTPLSSPTLLQQKLQNSFGSDVSVSNLGVKGAEARQLLDGTAGFTQSWAKRLESTPAQVVTLNFGINDVWFSRVITKNVKPETPSDFKATMTDLVAQAERAGKTVVLMEPNPVCDPVRQQAIVPYVQAIREVAFEQKVAIVHHFDAIIAMPNWERLLTDCVHPTDDLYRIKASAEFDILAPIVKKLIQK